MKKRLWIIAALCLLAVAATIQFSNIPLVVTVNNTNTFLIGYRTGQSNALIMFSNLVANIATNPGLTGARITNGRFFMPACPSYLVITDTNGQFQASEISVSSDWQSIFAANSIKSTSMQALTATNTVETSGKLTNYSAAHFKGTTNIFAGPVVVAAGGSNPFLFSATDGSLDIGGGEANLNVNGLWFTQPGGGLGIHITNTDTMSQTFGVTALGAISAATLTLTGAGVNGFDSLTVSNGITSLCSNLLAPFALTFPASTVPWTNNTGHNIEVYIDNVGITGTAMKKNGTQILGGLITGYTLILQPGESFSETYTVGTPTARWSPF